MTNTRRVGLVLGLVALVVAAILALAPATSGGVECGSVLAPKEKGAFGNDCSTVRQNRRLMMIGLGFAGLVVVLVSVVRPPSAADDAEFSRQ